LQLVEDQSAQEAEVYAKGKASGLDSAEDRTMVDQETRGDNSMQDQSQRNIMRSSGDDERILSGGLMAHQWESETSLSQHRQGIDNSIKKRAGFASNLGGKSGSREYHNQTDFKIEF